MNKKNNTFCILPWMHVATNARGLYRVCCNSTPVDNIILDNDGNQLKLSKHSIDSVWNTDYMKSLRKEMLTGIEPKICKRCFQEEKNGIESARQGYNEEYSHLIPSVLNNSSSDGSARVYVGYMDLRLGNLCNLKCVMCNPYASNQWLDEWSLINKKLSDYDSKMLRNMNWFDDNVFIEHLTPYLNTTEMIYLTGGEPTLAKSQYALLDKCIDLNISKNITLKYNTNLTNIPNRLLEYWGEFKQIKLNVSIDAYGELNDYIRFPSKWKIIDLNLKQLDFLAQDKNWKINVHCTVQMYNILHLTTLFDYLQSFDNVRSFPYLNILDHPEYLNSKVLPPHLKNQATELLENWREKNQNYYTKEEDLESLSKIDGVIKYMHYEDWSNLFEEFKLKTQILDVSRNLNAITMNPEFKDYF